MQYPWDCHSFSLCSYCYIQHWKEIFKYISSYQLLFNVPGWNPNIVSPVSFHSWVKVQSSKQALGYWGSVAVKQVNALHASPSKPHKALVFGVSQYQIVLWLFLSISIRNGISSCSQILKTSCKTFADWFLQLCMAQILGLQVLLLHFSRIDILRDFQP